MPANSQLFVQHFVDRRHLYSACSVTSHFVAELAGEGLEDFDTKSGTAFIVNTQKNLYFVTNRHVLDYNHKSPHGAVPSVALKSVEIHGYAQPNDLAQPAVPWSCTLGTTGIAFHSDTSTDLAVISVQPDSFNPPLNQGQPIPNMYGLSWIAGSSEIDSLMPGDEVYLAGYPGLAGAIERPVIVKGIIASDPRYSGTFANAADLGDAVLCHSFSWNGMSGAPVLGISESIGMTKLVGINAGHVGGSFVTGGAISHFVRSSALLELLQLVD